MQLTIFSLVIITHTFSIKNNTFWSFDLTKVFSLGPLMWGIQISLASDVWVFRIDSIRMVVKRKFKNENILLCLMINLITKSFHSGSLQKSSLDWLKNWISQGTTKYCERINPQLLIYYDMIIIYHAWQLCSLSNRIS